MNLNLTHKIFIAFTALLVIVLGVTAGITYFRGNAIANKSVISTLENIRTVQKSIETQRFYQLGLISEIFASDPYFSSYVAEAAGDDLGIGGEVDTASIVDLLVERQEELGFDFAMVLDAEGEVIAHSNDDEFVGADLTSNALVNETIESLESSSGYWLSDESIFQIAVVPLADQQDLVGFLLTALLVNTEFVQQIKEISGAELVFVNTEEEFQSLVSTIGKKELESLLSNKEVLLSALDKEPIEVKINNNLWLASVSNADEEKSNAITIALTSLDEAFADFRAIEKVLLISIAISILLALPISLIISRGVTAPVRRLAKAAQSAARGDYQQSFESQGKDEIAHLTTAFDVLLSDLREKDDMEGYMSDLAKYLPESIDDKGRGVGSKTMLDIQSSSYGVSTLVAIELRRFAKQADQMEPNEVFTIFNANLMNIDSLAKAYDGSVVGIIGHTVMVVFSGDDNHKRALTMAGNTLNSLMSQGEGIAIAIVQGNTVMGVANINEKNITNCIGSSVYQVDRFLRETISGHIFISPGIYELIKKEKPDFKPLVAKGLSKTKNYYALKTDAANIFSVQAEGETLKTTQVSKDGRVLNRTLHVAPGMSLGGRYEIISELGSGGMGVVYKAHDHELNDLVALKMLKIVDAESSAAFLSAMKSEIRLARKITHPAVLRTFDYGELDGFPYISMEYIRGLTLKYLISQRGAIPYSAGLRISKQLAAGLQAAHTEGILHRDIKPENIILEPNGNAKLMDFGIARQVTGSGLGTLEGAVMGTPRYAAPEQLQGLKVDERADIYSAGVLMFQMYTRKFPFSAKTLDQMISMKTTKDPDSPAKYWEDIPLELEELIMNCIARDPAERLATAEILLERLEMLRA